MNEQDRAWTEMVCRWASGMGYCIVERQVGRFFFFLWNLGVDGQLPGSCDESKPLALMRACWDLSEKYELAFTANCPRFFL